MSPPQRDRSLNDAECARMDAVLSRFRSEYAMNNREEIDGFLAALICSPDIAKPSEYLPEIYGGKMTHDEAVADREQLLDFWGLLTRHWDGIVRILHEEDVFAPLLLRGEGGIAHANDWATGFMRGTQLHHESWKALFDDKEHSCLLVPILVLAHEHDPDPEMRPSINIDVERREKLILGIAESVTAIYATSRRSVKEWKQGSTQKERHIVKQSETSDATVFDPSIQARNKNAARGKEALK